MRLFRAAAAPHYTGPWSCWTPDRACAEAYWDNPGFGGPDLLTWEGDAATHGPICDLTISHGQSAATEIVRALQAAGVSDGAEWLDVHGPVDQIYRLWEDYSDLRNAFQARYAWIVYTDDYPLGCETWVYLGQSPLPYRHIATRPTYAARALAHTVRDNLQWEDALNVCETWAGYDEWMTERRDPTGEHGLFCFTDGSVLRWTGRTFEIE